MPVVNLNDFEPLAREKLPGNIYDFIAGGAEDEVTLARNRTAFEAIRIMPRFLVDVSKVDTSTTVLDRQIPFPVVLAPVALHRLVNPEGELATARAAAQVGTIMTLSTMSSTPMEEVAAAAAGPKWFQLYCYGGRDVSERLVRRAEAAGFEALCMTVDVPRLGRRERDFRHALAFPPHLIPANFAREVDITGIPLDQQGSAIAAYAAALINPGVTWDDVDWMRSLTKLPLMLKGILSPEDARIAVDHGVAAIVVSNHGGRQLDGVSAGIEALPAIADAVGDRVELLVDGGVRRGTDVLKALALGAKAVMIGRPYIWGLAVDGQSGVARVLEMLRLEFEMAMALSGVTSADRITRSLIV